MTGLRLLTRRRLWCRLGAGGVPLHPRGAQEPAEEQFRQVRRTGIGNRARMAAPEQPLTGLITQRKGGGGEASGGEEAGE